MESIFEKVKKRVVKVRVRRVLAFFALKDLFFVTFTLEDGGLEALVSYLCCNLLCL